MIESIRYRREFQLLRDAGRYRRSGPLGLRSAHSDDIPDARVGYAIGRSVGPAVVRNRLRRRLRELVAEINRAGDLQPGLYLITAHQRATSATFAELRHHLSHLIREGAPG